MTYEEILERVKKKSTICPKCGCFLSSLLDCCPACGYKENNGVASASDSYLSNSYASMGGNAASSSYVLKIGEDGSITKAQPQTAYDSYLSSTNYNSNIDKPYSWTVVSSVDKLHNIKGEQGQIIYVTDVNQNYLWKEDYQWVQLNVPKLSCSDMVVEVTTLGSATTTLYQR